MEIVLIYAVVDTILACTFDTYNEIFKKILIHVRDYGEWIIHRQ